MGTNTFNLLIAEKEGNSFEKIYTNKIPVKLGENGFREKKLADEAMMRGRLAVESFLNHIVAHSCEKIYAIGTSAIRTAQNSKDFINDLHAAFGIEVVVIDGKREAELIYKGVRASGALQDYPSHLVMDIGGGSTEFILKTTTGEPQYFSFSAGAARFLELYQPSDPATEAELREIQEAFEEEAQPLWDALKDQPIEALVGCSGSFDSVASILAREKNIRSIDNRFNDIDQIEFSRLAERIFKSTKDQRYRIPGLVPMRVDFIVISTLFMKIVRERVDPRAFRQCDYSLKEGVVSEIIDSE